MRLAKHLWSWWAIALLGTIVLCGVGGWLQRDLLINWYYLERLSRAGEADRAAWVAAVAPRDSAVLPGLLHRLASPSAPTCHNIRAGIAAVVDRWPADDHRRPRLAERLAEGFARLSAPGQRAALELFRDWLTSPAPELPAEVHDYAVRLIVPGGRSPAKDVRVAAMALAGAVVEQERRPEVLGCCRELVRQGLQDTEPENRALAARLAARPQMNLLPQVAPLLDDPVPAVRKVAMIVVGPAQEAISTDDLLRSLHDTDEDVRRLCEGALRDWRGLRPEDVALGRLISDERPGIRLQVLENLRRAPDLEPGVWLRRLSHDPAPAVRAAAIRAAGENHLDLADRIRQMAQSDPSPTIRQLAEFYLSRQSQARSDR